MKLTEMMHIAVFTAIMGLLGLLPPLFLSFTPVPITLQTIGVLLSGSILKPKAAFLSQLLFLLIVACGAPLLSGGRGGFGVFFAERRISYRISAGGITAEPQHPRPSLSCCPPFVYQTVLVRRAVFVCHRHSRSGFYDAH